MWQRKIEEAAHNLFGDGFSGKAKERRETQGNKKHKVGTPEEQLEEHRPPFFLRMPPIRLT